LVQSVSRDRRETMRILVGLLAIFAIGAVGFMGTMVNRPSVVSSVDVERYMGLWYAVASIPTTFERACAQGTTAEYHLLANGQIEVTNTCYRQDGSMFSAVGRAWVPNASEPTKLKVSFVRFLGRWFFPGDYWILDLDPDYLYAVVGHPQRKYGWILSRSATLPEETLEGIFERLEAKGYDRNDFQRIDQSIHTGG
jgi:apolipoprotein D and lipocalin family protein